MASNPSPSTSTFIGEGQSTKQQKQHGSSDVATTSAHSYVVPKYVTDVAALIATSAESRQLFLTEVTRACLEAAKKEKAETNQTNASQLVQPPTNTNTTATKTVYSTSTYGNPSIKPVTMIYNTSGATLKKSAEEGKSIPAVTLFAPIGIAEDLSKTQFLLCGEIKDELKALKQSIDEIPFQELSKQVQDLTKNLETRMCSLELTHKTLKDIILQRTKQQSQLDSSLLERWNPSDTVLRYSPWTSMRLMLNLVAEDNITDLFPNDWQPVSPQSTIQQKHFQVLTEVMTEIFLHSGLVNDEWVIEVTNYQDFLKVLLHHLVMGNISTTQVTQFIILMVYMSICRLKHYSDAMEERHAMMLKSSIWMTLVIMAFRTTFTMMGGTKIINTYYRNIPAKVRRQLHVAVIRYMEQDCVCPNHVQCDIVPSSLTSEVVLPSYQHYLEREHHLKGAKVNESEALNQFGKTILMLILARVNGYYSPYTAQTIKEEEDRCFFGNAFTHSEKEFFKHRLQHKFPKISNKSLETALKFLEKQKLANCPCQVHTASRGYDWVIFRRQPDRTPTLYYEQTESESEEDEIHEVYDEDDDYYSIEPIDNENGEDKEGKEDAIGAATSSEVPSTEPEQKSKSEKDFSIHSRENEEQGKKAKGNEEEEQKKKSTEDDEEDMESNSSDDTDEMKITGRRRTNYICFKPLMYYNRHLDRYYYFRYFKPYKYDHRILEMGNDCGCLPRRVHKTNCSWYDDNNIFLLDTQADLSISEKVAQQKIYKVYMETQNNLPDECGCGTLASIFYMGHSTSCDDFKHVHERESHEVLLAILNKKKKLSFDAEFDPRHQNYEMQVDADAVMVEADQVKPIPDARNVFSELNNSSPQAKSMITKNVTSVTNLPNNPPNPSSITDIPLMNEEKPGKKPEDEEMPPLVDITDEDTG